jgi:hypothetical protein
MRDDREMAGKKARLAAFKAKAAAPGSHPLRTTETQRMGHSQTRRLCHPRPNQGLVQSVLMGAVFVISSG